MGTLIPHGVGRLLYCGMYGAYLIEGMFDNGNATGYCRWIWHDGLVYMGNLKNYKPDGQGIRILSK